MLYGFFSYSLCESENFPIVYDKRSPISATYTKLNAPRVILHYRNPIANVFTFYGREK